MKPGQASRTAVIVCMGRALAHGRTSVARFSDPTAIVLLPDVARARVERLRADVPPTHLRERISSRFLTGRSKIMVARTVTIDDVVREANASQLVILGAGLDGRAWRMSELRDSVVFEVDHPDTQRDKRVRATALTQTAREVRFVPVDFTRDDLDEALAAAGHDATKPTTWVWEGVAMYLTQAEIEATLAIVARRSTAGSRLIMMYHQPSMLRTVVGWYVARLGEPFRSQFSTEALAAVLRRHGLRVARDVGLATLGAGLTPDVAKATRWLDHLRYLTAVREG